MRSGYNPGRSSAQVTPESVFKDKTVTSFIDITWLDRNQPGDIFSEGFVTTANRYVYGAVEPLTGGGFFLVLPYSNTDCMNIFLSNLSENFPNDLIILACDRATWHRFKSLIVPDNIRLFTAGDTGNESHRTNLERNS
ncbi:MAG: hypothetical protein LBC82_07400 [Oscillospiraceae bacterium]|nr:hypothetical protein [Oscillospiraceae bacterium]